MDMECNPNCVYILYMVWIVVVFQFSENLCILAFGSCMYAFEFFFMTFCHVVLNSVFLMISVSTLYIACIIL